ncbi:MAG: hypothetical protein JNK82_23435 [Myxococcaceae bacterium]|nr:hypothetical protein [Myxococcaceae bacterium]
MRRLLLFAFTALAACQSRPVVSMEFGRGELFDAPVPSEDLLETGHPDLSKYPGRELTIDALKLVAGKNVTDYLGPQVAQYLKDDVLFVSASVTGIEREARGFGLNSGVFFKLQLPENPDEKRFTLLDPDRAAKWALPTREQSMGADATVFLMNVETGRRTPVDVAFSMKKTQYRPAALLSVVPWQGQPLEPGALHAAVIMSAAGGEEPFARPRFIDALIAGKATPELGPKARAAYDRALKALEGQGVDLRSVAGLSVFTTDDPKVALDHAFSQAKRDGLQLDTPFSAAEVYADYCVYRAVVKVPVYQAGTPPFIPAGGDWQYGPDGALLLQSRERANVVLTLPRRAAPAAGFPLAVFVRTGGGGEDPLLHRGVSNAEWNVLEPGTGPAQEFAREGYAGLSVDGPHGGLRNVTGMDEQVLVFNFLNPPALRDNIRQTAIEQALLAEWSTTLTVDASACPGLASAAVKFDGEHVALMGHSMGATIAPLVAALEPRYRALLLSGAGASWVENVLYKQKPWPIEELASLLIGYLPTELDRFDPVLSMVQWAADSADPLNYNRYLGDRHVLMQQGIVDHYIMPSIANAASASLGLDVAGPYVDKQTPELWFDETLEQSLTWSGRRHLEYPVSANRDGRTQVVVQHQADAIRDGHEVVFQTEPPKRQYRKFLRTFLTGTPVVEDPAN